MLKNSTEAEIVAKYRTDTLYTHEFAKGDGKYFTVVSEDENGVPDSIDYEHPYHPTKTRNRLKTTLTFIKQSGKITGISFKSFKNYKRDGWVEQEEQISFSYELFKKILGFLQLFEGLNLAEITERRIALAEDALPNIDPETRKKIKTLLLRKDGQTIIEELINSGIITSADIVNIGYRKKQLEVFHNLLNDSEYINVYRDENHITDTGIEKVWQFFFQKNNWIFGYGLDYRFLGILQKEAHIASTDLTGKDGAIGDFLLGCTKFTVLVELKRPDTPLFGKDRNRANSWTLSEDLIHGVSQILEQKASWQVFSDTNVAHNFNDDGEPIKQKTIDPKSVLIIGSAKQLEGENKEQQIKARTFELFRRDSRNLEIITFDELYERAQFIVNNSQKKPQTNDTIV